MTTVSSKEFMTNQKRYFDLAVNENVCIKRGKNIFHLIYRPVDIINDETIVCKSKSRHGWAKSAKEFVESGNEEFFFPDFFEDEDLDWWQWEQK